MSALRFEAFSLPALERLSQIIGERYTGTEITELFRKAGLSQIRHDGSTKWRFVYNALEGLQRGNDGQYRVAQVVQRLCDPQEFFGNPEGHASVVEAVNEVLSFYGLAADSETGRILVRKKGEPTLRSHISRDAELFDQRGFHHEVRKHGRSLFVEGRHFHAVFECCKAFDKFVSGKSGIDSHGYRLMSAALSLNGPLKMNALRTETERNVQEGVMHLSMGLMKAIRNPESHEPQVEWPMTREDALDVMSLVSFLYREVEKSVLFRIL